MPHPGVPRDWFRNKEGLGLWEGRGKVVATGVGTSPTARRWDEKPETSMGALTILAIRKAIADAGLAPVEHAGAQECQVHDERSHLHVGVIRCGGGGGGARSHQDLSRRARMAQSGRPLLRRRR